MTKKDGKFEQNLREGSNGIGTDKKRTKTKEVNSGLTEVLSVLSDTVTRAIFRHVVETGGCSKEDLATLDAVVEEEESLVRGLKDLGLIDVEGDTFVATEKGRKVLACIDELEALS